jgi:hypothetical protein
LDVLNVLCVIMTYILIDSVTLSLTHSLTHPPTHSLSHSIEHSPWKANSPEASQEILRISWNSMDRYRVHHIAQTIYFLRQIILVHAPYDTF